MLFSANAFAGWGEVADAYQLGDYKTAFDELTVLAEQGDVDAQFNLALMYNNGKGVLKDSIEAVKWYRLSAEQGIASAQNNLGVMHSNGDGVLKDYSEAAKWFRMSAKQGYDSAQRMMLLHYLIFLL